MDDHCEDVGCMVVDNHCVRTNHAEMNALIQAARQGNSVDGATAYVTNMPCTTCAKALIGAGIIKVIVFSGYHDTLAKDFFAKKRPSKRKRVSFRYDLAILYNPKDEEPPSDPKAIRKFVRAAESLGLETELIGKEDIGRLAEFDALFIRETTNVMHHTYRFARKADAEGIVVIDDPESILKCTNKVFLAELLEKNRVLTPKTIIVHRDNVKDTGKSLGFPCILKRPDSSFSQGVIKVVSQDELVVNAAKMFDRSEFIIAQEFLDTPYETAYD